MIFVRDGKLTSLHTAELKDTEDTLLRCMTQVNTVQNGMLNSLSRTGTLPFYYGRALGKASLLIWQSKPLLTN